jgi:hypothetical protein
MKNHYIVFYDNEPSAKAGFFSLVDENVYFHMLQATKIAL